MRRARTCRAKLLLAVPPVADIPGDADWRKEMAPVHVHRTPLAAVTGHGPVHRL